eukprot:TRINITY_DN15368_c0_g1_i1.p2 TRINITY_DN15368_c0_g1~~TRINITY_DN15368_c0_g1_i1.p2  ORF type:complete len:162 (-),score=22.32 TRINITY_DN15368_c0_g1_i1:107-592(-)
MATTEAQSDNSVTVQPGCPSPLFDTISWVVGDRLSLHYLRDQDFAAVGENELTAPSGVCGDTLSIKLPFGFEVTFQQSEVATCMDLLQKLHQYFRRVLSDQELDHVCNEFGVIKAALFQSLRTRRPTLQMNEIEFQMVLGDHRFFDGFHGNNSCWTIALGS